VYRYNLAGRQATLAGPRSCGDFELYAEDVFTLSSDGLTLDEDAVVPSPATPGAAGTRSCTSHIAFRFGRTAM
jgi:hypothetical protein